MAKDMLGAETSLRLLGGVPMQVGTSLTQGHRQGVLLKGKRREGWYPSGWEAAPIIVISLFERQFHQKSASPPPVSLPRSRDKGLWDSGSSQSKSTGTSPIATCKPNYCPCTNNTTYFSSHAGYRRTSSGSGTNSISCLNNVSLIGLDFFYFY